MGKRPITFTEEVTIVAKLAEMEAVMKAMQPESQTEEEDDDEDQEDPHVVDLKAAVELLKQAGVILSYVGDKRIIKAISVRERTVMDNMTSQINEFLGSVGDVY